MNTEEFNIINNWLGWGEPSNALWFIGVEEGGTWKSDNLSELEKSRALIQEMKGNKYTSYPNKEYRGDVNWPVAVVSAKIASLVTNHDITWHNYREDMLWLNGSRVFNGNLLSLGKTSLKLSDWPHGYKDLFGYTSEEYNTYYNNVCKSRYEIFKKFVKEQKPQAIVCYGMSHWDDFEKVFVSDATPTVNSEFKTKVYDRDKVILTRHFSNGMPDKTVDFIAKQLLRWRIEI